MSSLGHKPFVILWWTSCFWSITSSVYFLFTYHYAYIQFAKLNSFDFKEI